MADSPERGPGALSVLTGAAAACEPVAAPGPCGATDETTVQPDAGTALSVPPAPTLNGSTQQPAARLDLPTVDSAERPLVPEMEEHLARATSGNDPSLPESQLADAAAEASLAVTKPCAAIPAAPTSAGTSRGDTPALPTPNERPDAAAAAAEAAAALGLTASTQPSSDAALEGADAEASWVQEGPGQPPSDPAGQNGSGSSAYAFYQQQQQREASGSAQWSMVQDMETDSDFLLANLPYAQEGERRHHLLKHELPEEARGTNALRYFGVDNVRQAVRRINKMAQRELQEMFQRVYGVRSSSNNNLWLRKKLIEAVNTRPRSGGGGSAEKPQRASSLPTPPARAASAPSLPTVVAAAAEGSARRRRKKNAPMRAHDGLQADPNNAAEALLTLLGQPEEEADGADDLDSESGGSDGGPAGGLHRAASSPAPKRAKLEAAARPRSQRSAAVSAVAAAAKAVLHDTPMEVDTAPGYSSALGRGGGRWGRGARGRGGRGGRGGRTSSPRKHEGGADNHSAITSAFGEQAPGWGHQTALAGAPAPTMPSSAQGWQTSSLPQSFAAGDPASQAHLLRMLLHQQQAAGAASAAALSSRLGLSAGLSAMLQPQTGMPLAELLSMAMQRQQVPASHQPQGVDPHTAALLRLLPPEAAAAAAAVLQGTPRSQPAAGGASEFLAALLQRQQHLAAQAESTPGLQALLGRLQAQQGQAGAAGLDRLRQYAEAVQKEQARLADDDAAAQQEPQTGGQQQQKESDGVAVEEGARQAVEDSSAAGQPATREEARPEAVKQPREQLKQEQDSVAPDERADEKPGAPDAQAPGDASEHKEEQQQPSGGALQAALLRHQLLAQQGAAGQQGSVFEGARAGPAPAPGQLHAALLAGLLQQQQRVAAAAAAAAASAVQKQESAPGPGAANELLTQLLQRAASGYAGAV